MESKPTSARRLARSEWLSGYWVSLNFAVTAKRNSLTHDLFNLILAKLVLL